MMTTLFFDGDEHQLMTYITEQQYTQLILLVDANTNGHCIPLLRNLLPEVKIASRIIIPSGEQHKTLDTCCLIWNELNQVNAGRSSLLINVGGGMCHGIGIVHQLLRRHHRKPAAGAHGSTHRNPVVCFVVENSISE